MKERILNYRTRIDALLEENAPDTPWEKVLEEHLVQVGFFQHERLIHLMVTLAFAIMGVAVILVTCFFPSIGMFVLSLLFLCLLIPYIMHYYLLENETQKMYKQYDRILAHCFRNT
jgi:Flp pilus assembly protein TadB